MRKALIVIGVIVALLLIVSAVFAFVIGDVNDKANQSANTENVISNTAVNDNNMSGASNGAYSVQYENIGDDDAIEQNEELDDDVASEPTRDDRTDSDSNISPANEARPSTSAQSAPSETPTSTPSRTQGNPQYDEPVDPEYADTALRNKFVVPEGVDPTTLTYDSIGRN